LREHVLVGWRIRHVTVRPGAALDVAALAALIDAAYADIKSTRVAG
jgi:hypothetical protein